MSWRNDAESARRCHGLKRTTNGLNRCTPVREKAKELVELLGDNKAIRRARNKAKKLRNKLGKINTSTNISGGGGGGGGGSSSSERRPYGDLFDFARLRFALFCFVFVVILTRHASHSRHFTAADEHGSRGSKKSSKSSSGGSPRVANDDDVSIWI